MTTVKTFAPAKVNLTLHVTGQRADGYHLLDSLVAFADIGDRVTVRASYKGSFEVTGPMAAGVPADASNLAARAAALYDQPVALTLSKHLPMAAGLGGGSSDAAATLLALADLTGDTTLPAGALELGADVRVCLERRAARMRGIGEDVSPAMLPPLPAVLANPGVAVETPRVFAALTQKKNPPMKAKLPNLRSATDTARWLTSQRNDLEAPACSLAPEIGDTLSALAGLDGALLARMSGSGATCFALFADTAAATRAAESLACARPDWWVQNCTLA